MPISQSTEMIRQAFLIRELLARQRETSEARELLEKSGNPPLVSLNGIRECIQTDFIPKGF